MTAMLGGTSSRSVLLTALAAFVGGAAIAGDPWVAVAERARPGVVRIQWRAAGPKPAVEERNAIVIDAEGLLLMAGAVPVRDGTLTATFHPEAGATGDLTMRASVVAFDEETGLTLLWVNTHDLHPLAPLEVPRAERPSPTAPAAPPPPATDALPPGTSFVMVTGTGAVAKGTLRAHERRRIALRANGDPIEWTGLEEATLAAVAEDLGSPWLDDQGRVVGLLVGGAVVGDEPTDGAGPAIRPEPVAAHAVSARTIAIVWPLLKREHRVARARLGVRTRLVSDAVEKHVCRGCGAQEVRELQPKGPAETAGVEVHDLLVAVDGVPLRRDITLQDVLLPHRPGDAVVLDLVHKGQPKRVEAVLGSRDP